MESRLVKMERTRGDLLPRLDIKIKESGFYEKEKFKTSRYTKRVLIVSTVTSYILHRNMTNTIPLVYY